MNEKEKIIITDEYFINCDGVYDYYIVEHFDCENYEFTDNLKNCPVCKRKIIWKTNEGNMDGY